MPGVMPKKKPRPKRATPAEPVRVPTWGERLKAARKAQKLTQAKAAERLRITQAYVANIEADRMTPAPPITLLIELLERGEI